MQNLVGLNQTVTEEPIPHYFNMMPIIEYQNNKESIGNFEQKIGLIDSYNTHIANRVNLHSILVLFGCLTPVIILKEALFI